MTSRLVVLSNRIPGGDVPSGGLVVALHQLLAARGGLWIGAGDDWGEDGLRIEAGAEGYRKARFSLSAGERENYYLGYSNSVLWPLFHRRTDLMSLDRDFFRDYMAVNQRVAAAVAGMGEPGDLIWVHDYHFLPMAQELRKRGAPGQIGLFLHIPFPTSSDLTALPEYDQFHDWIASYDLVGLQTEADVARCLEMFRGHPDAELLMDGAIRFRDHVFRVASFPIGIDVEEFRGLAEENGRDLLKLPQGERIAIGVERLDYSKGLPQRFDAFDRWLSTGEPGPLTYLQIAAPSRDEVGAYQDLARELREAAGRINASHATLDRVPLRLLFSPTPRETLATLFRAADVGLVTPLADGMNLVAKEFVAAQSDDDPGVLILSRNAGAAEALDAALLVNPFDAAEMADAITTALAMPLDERRERQARLLAAVRASDIATWGKSFIEAMERPAEFEPIDASTSEPQPGADDPDGGEPGRIGALLRRMVEAVPG